MHRIVPIVFATLAVAAPVAHAADAKPQFDMTVDCSQWDHLSNYEMKQCSGRANVAADKELDAAYRQLMAKMDDDDRKLLVAAERAWITWRDRECDYETQGISGYEKSGTGYSLEWGQCRVRLTKARIVQLRGYLADMPGR
jgi:uncharacterized protein YecT (DUF1311 family)